MSLPGARCARRCGHASPPVRRVCASAAIRTPMCAAWSSSFSRQVCRS